LAVKGTSTMTDVHIDAALWSTVTVLQVFASVLPVLSLLPIDQVQWMIDTYHMPFVHNMEVQFWDRLVDLARNKTFDASDGQDFHHVFTGHSLGGGLAQVAAARLGADALVFSPPGMGYSARRFGIHRGRDYFPNSTANPWNPFLSWFLGSPATPDFRAESDSHNNIHVGIEVAKHKIVVVEPQADIVPQVDLQVGLTQSIECRIQGGYFGGAVDCHSMQKTACELWRSCGDSAGTIRGRSIDCIGPDSWQVPSLNEKDKWYTPDDLD